MSTLVLTKIGWKSYEDVKVGDCVLSFNPDKGIIEDDVVIAKHFFEDKEVFSYGNAKDRFECTEDHRWYGWKNSRPKKGLPRVKVFGFFTAQQITQEHNILAAAKYNWPEQPHITEDEARLVGWICSDGYYAWSNYSERTSAAGGKRKGVRCSISQAESKYWKEIEDLLDRLKVPYSKFSKEIENGNTVFDYGLPAEWVRPFFDRVIPGRKNKHEVNWTSWLLSLPENVAACYYETFYLGDGEMLNRANGDVVSQNAGTICDSIITYQLLQGKKVTFKQKQSDNVKCLAVRMQKKAHITCRKFKEKESKGIVPTFCLTTKNSTFIIKQESGYVGITGNCVYGAQAARIAKTVGCDLSMGQKIFDAFWEASQPLKDLKDRLTNYWKTTGGKKFIIGLDGRKINTRSEHALLNSLFQSGGIVCAKRVMVVQERLLKESGLSVDFWVDDWKKKDYVQQIMHCHDEGQFEVTKNLIKWKLFSDEETAKSFVKENTDWVGPGHSKKGYYVGLSPMNELIRKAVSETNSYYKMNVPLAVDPQYGENWKTCH